MFSFYKAALQAERAGYDFKTVLGAFLHDIGLEIIFTIQALNDFYCEGHLVGLENGLQAMTCNGTTLGTGDVMMFFQISIIYPFLADHDKVGEKFLQELGFPSEVTQFVRGHVQV